MVSSTLLRPWRQFLQYITYKAVVCQQDDLCAPIEIDVTLFGCRRSKFLVQISLI